MCTNCYNGVGSYNIYFDFVDWTAGERKAEKEKKKVRFAKDVVDPKGNNEEFRRHGKSVTTSVSASGKVGMPANRVALYNGMMRDRMIHGLGCSC